jgi:hypothetical protein
MDFDKHFLTKKDTKKSVRTSIYVERKLRSQSFEALVKSLLLISIKQHKMPNLRLKSCKQLIVKQRQLQTRYRKSCLKRRLLNNE